MSDIDNKVRMIVEGCLLAAGRPLTLDNIIAVFAENEKPDKTELRNILAVISEDCADRGFELKEVNSGFRFQVKQDVSEWVAKLWEERPPRYTRALLETLALIAYRQPITRGDIEEIRGVGVSSNIIRTLIDREWIRVVGYKDVPGKPAMFATTRQFLDYFNMKSLQELPPLADVKALSEIEQAKDLAEELIDQHIIDMPSEEESVELSEAEKAEMLAEEEAAALAQKPLDEILADDPIHKQEAEQDAWEEEEESSLTENEAMPEVAESEDGSVPESEANEVAEEGHSASTQQSPEAEIAEQADDSPDSVKRRDAGQAEND